MTPAEARFNCTHAPAYQKGCVWCSVLYMKMLRSADAKLSRKKQDAYLASLPAPIAAMTKEILLKERETA